MRYSVQIFNPAGFRYLRKKLLRNAASFALEHLQLPAGTVNIIFVTDPVIHQLNKQYLQHDYPTDILTFALETAPLLAELYISIDTAKAQAATYGVSLTNELLRLLFHGILHLAGFQDQTPEEKHRMRAAEDQLLTTFLSQHRRATKQKTQSS